MKKLILLDADVIIDLHSLNLFEEIARSYDIWVTEKVVGEAKHYPKGNAKIPIYISNKVTVITDVRLDCLQRVALEAREARLTVDPGEATSIAYLVQEGDEEIVFCTCDAAAIQLVAYMNLEHKSVSLECALRNAGHHRQLYPRHLESNFKKNINSGKALRVQHKKLT